MRRFFLIFLSFTSLTFGLAQQIDPTLAESSLSQTNSIAGHTLYVVYYRGHYRGNVILPDTPTICAAIQADGTGYQAIATSNRNYGSYDPTFLDCNSELGVLSPDNTTWLDYHDYTQGYVGSSIRSGSTFEVRSATGSFPRTLIAGFFYNHGGYPEIPTWTPDSQHILYWQNNQKNYDNSNDQYTGNLLLLDAGTLISTVVARFPEGENQPLFNVGLDGFPSMEISPDSSAVLFRIKPPAGNSDLFVIHLNGSGRVSLTNTPGDEIENDGLSGGWSPNGEQIVFDYVSPRVASVSASSANARGGPGAKYPVVNTFPSGATLTILDGREGWLKVLNDAGQQVWVSSSLITFSGGESTVEIMRADGTERRTLDKGNDPVWSPDGSRIAYACATGICVMKPDGSDMQPLGKGGNPRWSPGGDKIAFESSNQSPQGAVIDQVHIFDLKSNQDHAFLPHQTPFTTPDDKIWSPDGEWLLYRVLEPGQSRETVYICNLDGCKNAVDVLKQALGTKEDIGFSQFPSVRWEFQ